MIFLGCSSISYILFAHAKVRNLDVAVLVQHDVVQLQVSVDDTQGMKENDTNRNLSRIEPVRKYYY